MNIASSTWWMTSAFTFSQHAITTENKGRRPGIREWRTGPTMGPCGAFQGMNPGPVAPSYLVRLVIAAIRRFMVANSHRFTAADASLLYWQGQKNLIAHHPHG